VIGVVSVNVFVNAPVDVDVNLNVNPHEIASPWSPIDDERVDFVDAARCTLHVARCTITATEATPSTITITATKARIRRTGIQVRPPIARPSSRRTDRRGERIVER